MQGARDFRWCWVWLVLLGALIGPADGQVSGVDLTAPREFVGLGGALRPGTWTPIRVTLNTPGETNRAVLVQWRLRDYDGDEVVAERRATLNPNREQHVWLYATPPVSAGTTQAYTVQVVDAETGELLATQSAVPARTESPALTVVGVAGNASLGLDPYTSQYTQHEPIGVLRGLSLESMPDRWYGLDMLHSLIWLSDGGDPNAAVVTQAMQTAVREWVRRGGHLVIVLPAYGEPWTGSALADMLPVRPEAMRRIEAPLPSFVYDIRPTELDNLQMTVFDLGERDNAVVMQRLDTGEPVIIAGRYGFGRVTLMGLDLNDPRLRRHGLPTGTYRVWNTIYGWNSPVIDEKKAQDDMQAGKLTRPEYRTAVELGRFIPGQTSMTADAAWKLLLAILVFTAYWLAAGPLGFAVLKRRGMVRKSWLVFCATVGTFAVLSWGGAWLLKERDLKVAHFSVLDIDAKTGQMRVQSWLSLHVPEFGRVEVALAPGEESDTNHNTIANAGLLEDIPNASFPDPQPYMVDAASPNEVGIGAKADREWPIGVPVRSTAKQFTVNYLGAIGEDVEGITAPWVAPQGTLKLEEQFPVGTLSHNLPGELTNVLAVFVPPASPIPGESADAARRRAVPMVWSIGTWAAKTPLELVPPSRARIARDRLTQRLPNYQVQRALGTEGFLGSLMGNVPHQFADPTQQQLSVKIPGDQTVRFINMLSFYDALPPPPVYQDAWGGMPTPVYRRSLGRGLDLSSLTVGPKLILIGHIAEKSPLPVPLLVDGEPVEQIDASQAWTVVRWIYDL